MNVTTPAHDLAPDRGLVLFQLENIHDFCLVPGMIIDSFHSSQQDTAAQTAGEPRHCGLPRGKTAVFY